MKRIICIMIIITSVFLVSCAGESLEVSTESFTNEKIITTTQTEIATSATYSTATAAIETAVTTESTATVEIEQPTVNIKEYIKSGYARYSSIFNSKDIETPTKVIFNSFGNLGEFATKYFDKNDGEMHVFCSNPSCDHFFFSDMTTWTFGISCPAAMIGEMTNTIGGLSVAPLYINGRVYFVCFSGLYSCTDGADDLREEFKFGDNNSFLYEMNEKLTKNKFAIISVFSDGENIFFRHVDDDDNIIQYRYDTAARELHDMTDEIKKAEMVLGNTVYVDSASKGKIYLAVYSNVTEPPKLSSINIYSSGDLVGYYMTDYDFSSFEKIEEYIATPDFVTENGVIGKLGDNYVLRDYSGESIVLIKDADNVLGDGFSALYINGRYLYYIKNENMKIGTMKALTGNHDLINKSGGKIYRYDFETKKSVCMFNDRVCDNFRAVYIDEASGGGFISTEKYIELSNGIFDRGYSTTLIRYEISSDGIFTEAYEVISK